MTLQERGIIARRVHANMAFEKAMILRRMMNDGLPAKQAAYYVGVSERTASRYRHRAMG